jgi:ribosomal protein S18 acetylase RimI-like enzyme
MAHIEIKIVNTGRPPRRALRKLLREYLNWGNENINQRYGYNFNIELMIESDLQKLEIYSPERGGRLLLAKIDNKPVGMVGLHQLADQTTSDASTIAEIKRLYVRSEARGYGIGRMMLQQLLTTAINYGYTKMRLETMAFMPEAIGLYRSMGFHEIEAYTGTAMPPELHQNTIFMELDLPPKPTPSAKIISLYNLPQGSSASGPISGEWMSDKELPHYISRFYRL